MESLSAPLTFSQSQSSARRHPGSGNRKRCSCCCTRQAPPGPVSSPERAAGQAVFGDTPLPTRGGPGILPPLPMSFADNCGLNALGFGIRGNSQKSCKATVRGPLAFRTCQLSPSGFPSQGWGIWGWCGEQHHKLLQRDERPPPHRAATLSGRTRARGGGRSEKERTSAHVEAPPCQTVSLSQQW